MSQLASLLKEAEMNVVRIKAAIAKENRQSHRGGIDAIELPGGRVVELNEVAARQSAEQARAEEEHVISVFESMGMPRNVAELAARRDNGGRAA